MKFVLVMMLLFAGCTKRSGVTNGVLIDAANEGAFVMSCEIDIQYGKESSNVENFSSRNTQLCETLMDKTGKEIKIKYHYENISLTTISNYIIDHVEIDHVEIDHVEFVGE